MKAKSTRDGHRWEEGKPGETLTQNPKAFGGKELDLRHAVTCNNYILLKACAYRLEKPFSCLRNGADRDAHIHDPHPVPCFYRAISGRGSRVLARSRNSLMRRASPRCRTTSRKCLR